MVAVCSFNVLRTLNDAEFELSSKMDSQENVPSSTSMASSDPNARLPLKTAVPLAVQHVLAMFASNVTIPIILAGVVGASSGDTTKLVQIAILVAGLATLVQTIGIGPFGARLPVVQGTGFVFAAVSFPIAAEYGISAVFGGAMVAAVVQIILGFVLRHVMFLFPPIVLGLVIMSVGLGLLPTGIGLAAGGVGSPDFASPQNFLVAGIVLGVALLLNHYGRRMLSAAAVLIAIVIGYFVAIPLGMVDFDSVKSTGWVSVAIPFEFGITFPLAAVVAMGVVGVINALDSIGSVVAITKGGADRDPTDKELAGTILADGVGSALAGVFGTVPNTAFSQNAGLVALTRVMSRQVVAIGGGILILLSLFPKGSALIAAMPSSVLGGAAVLLFGTVLAIGVKMLGETGLDQRLLIIVATSIGIGQGIALVPETLVNAPEQLQVLLETGVVPTAFVGIILSLILRDRSSSGVASLPYRSRKGYRKKFWEQGRSEHDQLSKSRHEPSDS